MAENSPRTEGAMSSMQDVAAQAIRNYSQSSGCSIEQIFTPLQTTKAKSSSAATPGFRPPTNIGGESGSFGASNIGPTVYELDPYFPRNVVPGDSDGSIFFNNCDYQGVITDPSSDLNQNKNNVRVNVTTARTMGLRSPVILSGWGFDLADTPVPYTTVGELRTFDTNLVSNRSYWKTGPLHVMWDEERQVWSGGPQIVVGAATSSSTAGETDDPGSFTMVVLRAGNSASTLTDGYGESITCKVRDPNLSITTGDWVVAARINYEWIPIQAGGGGSMYIGSFTGAWDKGTTTTVTQVDPDAGGNTVTVTVRNLFADVGGGVGEVSSCAYTRIGGTYYLIAAECS